MKVTPDQIIGALGAERSVAAAARALGVSTNAIYKRAEREPRIAHVLAAARLSEAATCEACGQHIPPNVRRRRAAQRGRDL